MQLGIKPGQYGWSFRELEEAWRAAEQRGFAHLSCFDHVTAAPRDRRAWDAPSLLVAMAGVTDHIELTVEVLNASLRHPALLASQLAVAQAASGGRLRVGLGLGSAHLARFDHQSLGIEFPSFQQRADRLERCCRLLPALWRGETVREAGDGMAELSLGALDITPPPVWVGGVSERVLSIAVDWADGWLGPPNIEQLDRLNRRLDELAGAHGRARPLRRGTQLFSSELGDVEEQLRALEEAGIDTVTIVLHDDRGASAVHAVADRIGSALALWAPTPRPSPRTPSADLDTRPAEGSA